MIGSIWIYMALTREVIECEDETITRTKRGKKNSLNCMMTRYDCLASESEKCRASKMQVIKARLKENKPYKRGDMLRKKWTSCLFIPTRHLPREETYFRHSCLSFREQ